MLIASTMLPLPTHANVAGKARVIDGDTIEIAVERIHLQGIDAPARQRGGTRHADTT